jgi:hypothetical protein
MRLRPYGIRLFDAAFFLQECNNFLVSVPANTIYFGNRQWRPSFTVPGIDFRPFLKQQPMTVAYRGQGSLLV